MNPPPLNSIVALLFDCGKTSSKEHPLFDMRESEEPLRVPNYEDIDDQVCLLAFMLSDIRAFVEFERDQDKATTGGITARPNGALSFMSANSGAGTPKKRPGNVELLLSGLTTMHNAISESTSSDFRELSSECIINLHS